MKSRILLLLLLSCSLTGFSQTKKIAHRSHSGKNSTFAISGRDNFGETPEMAEEARRRKVIADSLAKKAVADSLARVNKQKMLKKPKSRKKRN